MEQAMAVLGRTPWVTFRPPWILLRWCREMFGWHKALIMAMVFLKTPLSYLMVCMSMVDSRAMNLRITT